MLLSQTLISTALFLFILALTGSLAGWTWPARWSQVSHYLLDIGFLVLSVNLFLECIAFGVYVPVANEHQALVFFAWSVLLIFLFVRRKQSRQSFGLVIFPLVSFLLGLAVLRGRSEVTIPPAYMSDQLFAVHTLTAFFAYAAFALSFVASTLFLLQHRALKHRRVGRFTREWPPLEVLEHTVYKAVLLGVPLLAVTLITGFVWSKRTLGHYWLSEPKVLCATLTWFLYAFLLYLRYVRAMRGTRVMTYALVSFSLVIFTFLGAAVLGQEVHRAF